MEWAIGIAGISAAIAGLALTYWLGRPGWKLANRQLRAGNRLEIKVYRSSAEHILWVFPKGERRAFLTRLEFSLNNKGFGSIEDVAVEVELPSFLYIPPLPRNYDSDSRLMGVERFLDSDSDLEMTRLLFKIPVIHPNVKLTISDEIFLPSEGRFESSVEAVTRDGVPITARYSVGGGWGIKLSVVARNLRAASKVIKIYCYAAGDEDLALLDDVDGAMAALNRYRGGPIIPALVFWPNAFSDAPSHLEKLFTVELKQIELRNVPCQSARYFEGVGYLLASGTSRRRARDGETGDSVVF